jgi:hypothetical protein
MMPNNVANQCHQAWQTTAVDDPVLCGPCAIARWLQAHEVIVTKIATPAVSKRLRNLEPLISTSPHACREPIALDDRSGGHPLLAPVNQWDTPRSR